MRPVVFAGHEPTQAWVDLARDCAAVALAVPDEAAVAWTAALAPTGTRVLDLSTAHRLTPGSTTACRSRRPAGGRAAGREPGLHPTASLLVLAPLLRAGLCAPQIAVHGASGTSGAGKALREDLHFSELFGNSFPYKVGTHKHIAEIAGKLGAEICFVTQMLPVVRGLAITAYVHSDHPPHVLQQTLARFYDGSPWVTVLPEPGLGLGLRHVVGTHQAILAVGPVAHGGMIPVFATIDNLMRGAASQALHNLNLWLGLPAGMGLPAPAGPSAIAAEAAAPHGAGSRPAAPAVATASTTVPTHSEELEP
ncbi:MAG: Asd/ArgC dimerization domain-containing protein [Nannocystaceae bacterium]